VDAEFCGSATGQSIPRGTSNDYLIGMIERDERTAAAAIEAIGRSGPSEEMRARVEAAMHKAGNPRLQQALREHLTSAERG
jgi:hypothetical protein